MFFSLPVIPCSLERVAITTNVMDVRNHIHSGKESLKQNLMIAKVFNRKNKAKQKIEQKVTESVASGNSCTNGYGFQDTIPSDSKLVFLHNSQYHNSKTKLFSIFFSSFSFVLIFHFFKPFQNNRLFQHNIQKTKLFEK